MKTILYIHQYFKTPEEGGAIRSYYIAKGLVENGYGVTMITSHNSKHYQVKNIEGIEVHYLPVYYDNKLGLIGRVISFLKFTQKAISLCKKLPKNDLCYASSTPLTVGVIAMRIKKTLGIPYFFEVRDLWPEAPIQLGAVRNGILKKYLFWLEKKIYQNADKIIALSPGIRDNIEKIVPNKKVYIVPNMSDTDFFRPSKRELTLRPKDQFTITYFGAIGKSNNLESIVNLAKSVKEKDLNINFKIAGKGSELDRLKTLVWSKSLVDFVEFIPFSNKEGVRDLLNVSDAVYISFDKQPILMTNSPNKFFDALAAGKMIILNTDGWLREVCEEHQCGFYYSSDNYNDFILKIRPFLENSTLLLEYQKNARDLAELYYSRSIQIEKILKIFDNQYKMKLSDDKVYTLTA